MGFSIMVDDSVRKQIKKLAAELDTTQGVIVAEAIRLFEAQMAQTGYKPDPKVRKFLQQLGRQHMNEDPAWDRRRKVLAGPGIEIDDLMIVSWESGLESDESA